MATSCLTRRTPYSRALNSLVSMIGAQAPYEALIFRSSAFATQAALSQEAEVPLQVETFYARDLIIQQTTTSRVRTPLEDIKWGTEFSDHMFLAEHAQGQGWGAPKIVPFGVLPVHPAASVMQYGMSCFEGMKAFRGPDGRGLLFRPDMNMARLRRSARRLSLADFDPQEMLECLKAFVRQEDSWLPDKPGYSLYLRPYMFASSFSLGVLPPTSTSMAVVACVTGPYYPSGTQPITLFLNEDFIRAPPGGVGNVKAASNYGPTIYPQQQAFQEYGTPQVVYSLPASSGKADDATVSEGGAMNIMFVFEKVDGSGLELATAPLDGTILPGVTRDSILQLARSWNSSDLTVSERPITILEIKQAAAEGRLREVFCTGTAFVVQPVSALVRKGGDVYSTTPKLPAGGLSLASQLRSHLEDLQYGRVMSNWSVPV